MPTELPGQGYTKALYQLGYSMGLEVSFQESVRRQSFPWHVHSLNTLNLRSQSFTAHPFYELRESSLILSCTVLSIYVKEMINQN